ncbi:CBN-DHS-20 protein [Aphelenchoides avenae]|nr:CBN-DHS-20 protein [Aphelenchus avenae]
MTLFSLKYDDCDQYDWGKILLLSAVIYYTLRYLWELIPVPDLEKRAIFVSGCDTGFGRLLALKCAEYGILCYAGCLTPEGQSRLEKETAHLKTPVVTVPLDVTSDESVNKAAEFVTKDLPKGKVLWALINNAGIFSCYGPDAWLTIDEYKRSMDVNLYGVVRCTHAFLPLLKKSKGRVVTTTSVSGRFSVVGGGPYSAAKYAAESYMDTIRQELRPFGITCCIIEPGIFRTGLIGQEAMMERVNRVWSRLPEETKEEYGEKFKNTFVFNWNEGFQMMATNRLDYVVDAYYHAITARFPRLRYRCGWDCLLVYIPVTFLPTEIEDGLFRIFVGNRNAVLPAALEKPKAA